MKKILLVAVALACCAALWAADAAKGSKKTMTLDEAKEKIAEVVKNPEKMGEITARLSAEDQNAFMAEVNKAIISMPGSNEQKTAKFLTIEREALLAAKAGNLQPLVATMFVSVTLESLTVLAERYADDLFNRSADANKTFTDEQFTEIASSSVKVIAKKCEALPDKAQRDALAIYLFERSSDWEIPELEDRLLEIAFSDPEVRAVAKNEWLAEAKNGDFSSLLASADAGRTPNVDVTLRIAGPQVLSALLTDLGTGVIGSDGKQILPITMGESPSEKGVLSTSDQAKSANAEATGTKPVSPGDVPWNPSKSRDQVADEQARAKIEEDHPGGYQWQK